MALLAPLRRDGKVATTEGSPTRRRNLPLTLVAVLVAAGSALAFALLWTSAAAREPVLAMATTVLAGEVIEDTDLAVVEVSADPLLAPIPAGERGRVVGTTAAVSLVPGTLLTEAHLGATELVAPGEALVGVALQGAQLPTPDLRSGDHVRVVRTLPEGAEGSTSGQVLAPARVFAVTAEPDTAGVLHVSLAVEAEVALRVAAAAASDQVSLVLVPQP